MKILHYIPSIDETSGGVGAYMQLLTRDLGKLCDLHVVTHKGNNERVLENCKVHYIPYKWMPWNNCKQEFLQLLKELQPDAIHVNCCWQPVPAKIAVWAKAAGYKVVYTPHGMLEPYAIKRHYWTKKLPAILMFQKKGIQAAYLIHATAESEKKNLIALGWNKNVTSIANCVQIDKILFKYEKQNENEYRLPRKRSKNILFLSRVHVKKGINFLIEAVAKLRYENKNEDCHKVDYANLIKDYTITIAGPGEESYINELKALTKKCGVADMFKFIGPVYADAKWPLYRKADLFVLPTWSENFGIVVPEALASGTPVVTTVGTPWEELNTCHCGWWTEIGTKPTVAALKQFLACSDADLEQMGRNGRKLVEDKYTSEAIAMQFVEMYESLVNG